MKKQDPLLKITVGDPIPLVREDLVRLHEGNRTGVVSLAKLRQSHHRIARLAATGQLTNKEIAALTGYSQVRVNQLIESPAMKELIAAYAERIAEREMENVDAYLELKTQNMIAAERHIADRIEELDEAGELMPFKTALAISADGADRTGYGKRQTNVNINADLGNMLERAIRRSRQAKVIDSAAVPERAVVPPHSSRTPQPEAPLRPLIARRA